MKKITPKDEALREIEKLKDDATFEEISNLIYGLDKENQVWINEKGRKIFTIAGIFAVLSLGVLLSDWFTSWSYDIDIKAEVKKIKLPYLHGIYLRRMGNWSTNLVFL